MNIYTKTGDKGSTSLVGGSRVNKNHPRVEAYGNVDELISHLGLLKCDVNAKASGADIRRIQSVLMLAAAHFASDKPSSSVKPFDTKEITYLENEIDKMQAELPVQKAFILPGGPAGSSQCHIARTVCRRAERSSITLIEDENLEPIIKYLNRLSDYLFVLARYISYKSGEQDDFWQQ